MLHIPILRGGEPYTSLETLEVPNFRTGEPLVRVSQANSGLIAKDLNASKRVLQDLSPGELLTICTRAAHAFMEDELPLGEVSQSPREYVQQPPQGFRTRSASRICGRLKLCSSTWKQC
jgi:hypothetical protein